MNNHRTACDEFVAEFVIERYAAGQLPEAETAAFEEHLLTCGRCQSELTLAVAVREALPEAEAEEAEEDPTVPRRLPWKGMGVGLSLAAAAAVTLMILPRDRVSGEVAELGRVTQPPVYFGVPVRHAPARPDSVFGAAMSAYLAGEYSVAATGLEAAVEAGAGPVPAEFFRGASLLMLDRPADAEQAFSAVIDAGDSPYLAEAHFYRAKALLSQGRVDEAQVDLAATSESDGEIAASAKALADSVEAGMGG